MNTLQSRVVDLKRLAITAPIASALNTFLLYGLFMNPLSQQIIYSRSFGQSPKLVAVWTQIEPVPSWASLIPALVATPIVYTIVFALLHGSVPGKSAIRTGFNFGIIMWGLVPVFFELFTPLGLFGEPLHLLVYELSLWFVALVIVGSTIGKLYLGARSGMTSSSK